ncbi:cold shock domain-containing protein [Nocardia nova]|uniref:cold shock domain-containing protein n=1 Tax=Nocardia nova TaxID=37330 RepID=UPI00350E4CEB
MHFSAIEGEGFRELAAGDRVEFDYESAQQDRFRYRATWVRRIDVDGHRRSAEG